MWNHEGPYIWSSEFWVFHAQIDISKFQMCYDCLIQNLYYQAWCGGESAILINIHVPRISARFININFDCIYWEKWRGKKGSVIALHPTRRELSLRVFFSTRTRNSPLVLFYRASIFSCGMSSEIKELSLRAPHNIQFQKGIKMYVPFPWTICTAHSKN